jgi:hypothetical protein
MPAATAATANNFVKRVVTAAKSDLKKTCVLAVLVAVLGVMWVRMAMSGGGGPAQADAAPVASGDSLTSDKDGVSQHARSGGRASVASAALGDWRRAPVSPVVRNLFVVPLDNFAQQGGRPTAAPTRSENGFWDELAKSMAAQADLNKQRQIIVDNTVSDAEKLKVQTIVMGASPKAVVNGEVVVEGSVVAGFRVSKIEARRIIVEREGIKLEIPMK